jgi:hypothetical protein
MEDFSIEVIANIKSANDEAELIRVISNSMSQLRKQRKSFDESRYLLHMIVCLRATEKNELSSTAASNIKLAMAIFRQFQKASREGIF